MLQFLISIVSFIVVISVLVAVHEFGHFWVARRFGIKVLRFSIGFGRPFFRWYDKLGTEYVLSYIPLGGYVSLFGEKEANIPPAQQHQAFSYKPVSTRILVLAAGPFANLLFAVFAYWLMFMIGITSMVPIVGQVAPGSIADLAGLKPRDEIISIENKPTDNWEAVSVALVHALGNERSIKMTTKPLVVTSPLSPLQPTPSQPSSSKQISNSVSISAQTLPAETSPAASLPASTLPIATPSAATLEQSHTLDLTSLVGQEKNMDLLKELGITPFDPYPPIVGSLFPDYPAANAGLKPGDRIIAINGHKMLSRSEVTDKVQSSVNDVLTFDVIRAPSSEAMQFKIQPVMKRLEDGKMVGFAGIEYDPKAKLPPEVVHIQRYGPWIALKQACQRTWDYTLLTLTTLKKMVVGSVSVKHLSGPISIAQYAGYSVSIGIEYFLGFLAVISISLGVINLLPIPILDGGHLLYCFYEVLTGRKVSEHAQQIGVVVGGIILISVMLIAFYNDILRF